MDTLENNNKKKSRSLNTEAGCEEVTVEPGELIRRKSGDRKQL